MSGNVLNDLEGDISDDGAGIDEHDLPDHQREETAREDAENQKQSGHHSGRACKVKAYIITSFDCWHAAMKAMYGQYGVHKIQGILEDSLPWYWGATWEGAYIMQSELKYLENKRGNMKKSRPEQWYEYNVLNKPFYAYPEEKGKKKPKKKPKKTQTQLTLRWTHVK